jgi:hypothetical protein
MSWYWIAIALTVPLLVALLVALPFWLKFDPVIGNVLAAGVIFVGAIALVGREYVEIQRTTMRCLQAGIICSFSPEPFTRFAIYGLIGLLEASLLFAVSIKVEERIRGKSFAPEWRG